jgi:hypothetical protein
MNCKGNELAYLVVPKGRVGEEHNGKIVFITTTDGYGFWTYEGSLVNPQNGIRYDAIHDRCLRPFKNPGDEEVDETLTWKCGKPPKIDVKSKETADANG